MGKGKGEKKKEERRRGVRYLKVASMSCEMKSTLAVVVDNVVLGALLEQKLGAVGVAQHDGAQEGGLLLLHRLQINVATLVEQVLEHGDIIANQGDEQIR